MNQPAAPSSGAPPPKSTSTRALPPPPLSLAPATTTAAAAAAAMVARRARQSAPAPAPRPGKRSATDALGDADGDDLDDDEDAPDSGAAWRSNRGRKLQRHVADLPTRPAPPMAPHPPAAPTIEEIAWQGKQTTSRMFAYVPPPPATTTSTPPPQADPAAVSIPDLLQPAISLDNIVHRPELAALFKPRHLESMGAAVVGLVEAELDLHNALGTLIRVLQKDDPDWIGLEFGEPEVRARQAAYDMFGASSELITQLQDVSLGLNHVGHQQQFLWKVIKERVRIAPPRQDDAPVAGVSGSAAAGAATAGAAPPSRHG
ncbi:hypothetical protein GGF31_005286 [Allomyces arbusculus]|nr:hypothetical protein GGF31_005286 [Allomyces arbusculus]